MRINDAQVRKNLENAYKKYSDSSSEADIEVALLGLHTGLENALRSYLKASGVHDVDYYQVSFPDLVNMVRDKTGLFAGDPGVVRLLVSLNTTRNGIAHPDEGKPSPQQIENDARQFAKLIRRFWPSFFGDSFPADLEQSRPKPIYQYPSPEIQSPPKPLPPEVPHPQESPRIHPTSQPRKVEPIRTRPHLLPDRSKLWFGKLWADEREPRLHKLKLVKRLVALYLLFTLSTWLKSASFFTARWPEPVKYAGVVLFILAGAAFLWGCIVAGKILAQLRVKRLLLFISFLYVFYIAVVLLTPDNNVPIAQQLLITNRRLIDSAKIKTIDTVLAVLGAPSQFRSLYSGHGNPADFALRGNIDEARLTPIPANSKSEQMNPEIQKAAQTSSAPLSQFNRPNEIFSKASIYSIGFLENGNLLVTIQVPGGISGDYQGYIKEETFKCTILEAYPNRLYCNGPRFEKGQQLTIRIQELSSNEMVYEAKFTVPP